MPHPITLLTDFGLDGPYVGAMKGAILSISPEVAIVDLSHEAPRGDVLHAAFLLAAATATFPPEAIHVAVVDPGVGSARRGIALETERGTFIAPDNGLLSFVPGVDPPPATEVAPSPRPHQLAAGARAVHLREERFWRAPVSRTFHGRDIFAPVAAHLSRGTLLEELGPATDHILALSQPVPRREPDGTVVGKVILVDRFGNLVTSIRAEDLPPGDVRVEIAGRVIQGLSDSYVQGAGLLAIVDSMDRLEVAATNGHAAAALGVGVGAEVRVRAG